MDSIPRVFCSCMIALFFISSAHATVRQPNFRPDEGVEKVTQHISMLDFANPSPTPAPTRAPIPLLANEPFPESDEGTEKVTQQHISIMDYSDPFPTPVFPKPPMPPPANKQFPEQVGVISPGTPKTKGPTFPKLVPSSQQMTPGASIPTGGLF